MAIAAAGGAGAAWQMRMQTAEAERARAHMERRIAQLREERQRLENRLAQSARTRTEVEVEKSTLEAKKRESETKATASPSSAASSTAGRAPAPKRADVWERSIRREPELQALRIVADRARRATDFESFFRRRGLGVGQIAQFQAIASAHDEAMADIDAAVQSQGLAEDDPSVERLRQAAKEENDVKLGALLGRDGLRQFREFEQTLTLRSAVRGFAAVALEAGVPLTGLQAEQLAGALVESRNGSAEKKVTNWSTVDEHARGFLTPSQLTLLQRVEPNVHGAGGRRWLALHEVVAEAKAEDERRARNLQGLFGK
jgi:hypothetical protein